MKTSNKRNVSEMRSGNAVGFNANTLPMYAWCGANDPVIAHDASPSTKIAR